MPVPDLKGPIPDIGNPVQDLRGSILGLGEPILSMRGFSLCLRDPKRQLKGLQNPYLLLEHSSIARAIQHLFVSRWPEEPTDLKGGGGIWLLLARCTSSLVRRVAGL